jgi:electron transfer flavoprotein alpha subunit
MMEETIIVIAEHFTGRIKPITYELIAFAKALAQKKTLKITGVILGEKVVDLARNLADVSGLEVMAVQIPGLAEYTGEIYRYVLVDLLSEFQPTYLCIAHTSQGLDFAPALAAELNAACITAVEEILEIGGRICFARPMYGGKITAHVCPTSATAVLTIQPGIFKIEEKDITPDGSVNIKSIRCPPQRSRLLGIKPSEADTAGITEADVIVAAGQGIGEKDNLDLIHQLAALFTKSAVAGSRLVCDRGWLEYRCQVGVTGTTVSPQLYIACGISGAIQHISGMRSSEFIIAINKDPSAAIFQVADVCIVEDLTTFIPTLIEAYKRKSS